MIGEFFLWLQGYIKYWTKPAAPVSVSSLLSNITGSCYDLIVANAVLRQQLIALNRQVNPPQLTNPDYFRLVLMPHFTKFWKQAFHIVQPNTLLRWRRE